METQLLVYIDLQGETHLVGTLWARSNRGRQSASFEYHDEWLNNPVRFALEPALTVGKGPYHTGAARSLFGGIGDSAPDRWGRVLIQREEARKAREENRAARTLLEVDYLLGVSDVTRQGALRFAKEKAGPFLAATKGVQVPPLVRLAQLLNAALLVSADKESDEDLKLLVAPGSSLGGARPKASVLDNDGNLLIAKFPQHGEKSPIPLWEAVALKLASAAGIPTPEWRVEQIGDLSVLLLRRFDRENGERIPFLSAMSLLGAADNETHSYMEIADALRQHGARPNKDCEQLWRRMVFNILVSNTDDHLRNHGVLYEAGAGWRLAPAYDLNPTPIEIKPRVLCLAIDEVDNTASLEVALTAAKHFGVKPQEAHAIAMDVGTAVNNWRRVAESLGLSRDEIERMRSAFEHDDLKRSLTGK
jgi:serine/threonine-protein kinase HipA